MRREVDADADDVVRHPAEARRRLPPRPASAAARARRRPDRPLGHAIGLTVAERPVTDLLLVGVGRLWNQELRKAKVKLKGGIFNIKAVSDFSL